MKNVILLALLAMVMGGFSACVSNTFDYPDRESDGRVFEESRAFYFGGLMATEGPLIAHELCNGPVKSVETVHTPGNMCISCITLQIYTPNTVRVTCAAGVAHNFYLDDDDTVVGHEQVDLESGEIIESNFQSDFI